MTDDSHARIADLVAKHDVLLFMKGSPLFPQCGFSSKAIAILEHLGVEFGAAETCAAGVDVEADRSGFGLLRVKRDLRAEGAELAVYRHAHLAGGEGDLAAGGHQHGRFGLRNSGLGDGTQQHSGQVQGQGYGSEASCSHEL